jgi:hypothetical protein
LTRAYCQDPTRLAKRKNRFRAMAVLYKSGKTLQEIGDIHGITRERVRQCLRYIAVAASEGGQVKRAEQRRSAFEARRNIAALEKWGCGWEEYVGLRSKKITRTFNSQRQNAKNRGIGWEINLWQWWLIWQQSGKWHQRGRGQGYVMCRCGDLGPYAIGNVYIATGRENSSREHAKISGLPMGVSFWHGKYRARRCLKNKVKYLGCYATAELAHAAYLAAEGLAA